MAKHVIKNCNAMRDVAFLLEEEFKIGRKKERRHYWTGYQQATLFSEKEALKRIHDLRRYNKAMGRNEWYTMPVAE